MTRWPILKHLFRTFFFVFILLNVILCFQAYSLTHYDPHITGKTADPHALSSWQKTVVIFTGVHNPRPVAAQSPDTTYHRVMLESNKRISGWWIETKNPKGTVILFHGFGGEKSSMLGKAAIFRDSGFSTLLIDFMGSGESEGNQTTIGCKEAEEVKTAFDFIRSKGTKHIVLYGTSMGAVAIMRAEALLHIKPEANIIECPYGTLLTTVKARFRNMGLPSFPMAPLLVFWGGLENGFNGFSLNPDEYAKSISVPTLLMYGGKDDKVSMEETQQIFSNLNGVKKLAVYSNSGHENYLLKYKKEWSSDIGDALNESIK